MFKAIFITCVCFISLNILGLTDAKPIAGFQSSENPKVTTIQIPRTIISGEELIALAQYVMRMMASRINITLQAAPSRTDFPRYPDHVPVDSGYFHSTTPSVVPSKDYELLGNTRQINYEVIRCADQKLQYPCRTAGGPEKFRSPAQNSGPRFTINGRPFLTSEPFVGYPERNTDSFQDQFGFEILPNQEISPPYIPQAEKSTAVLPLMEQVLNRQVPKTSVGGDKNSGSPNIRIRNLTIERVPSSKPGNSVISVPFEAIINFARHQPSSPKLEVEDANVVIPTRDPPDDFPPYFETVLSVGTKKTAPKSVSLDSTTERNLNPIADAVNEVMADKKNESLKPMKKRQTSRVTEAIKMLGLSRKRNNGNRKGSPMRPTPTLPLVQPSRNMKAQKLAAVTLQEATTTPPKGGGPMSQRQEFDDDDDEDEGSLGSLADLLPLVIPILEDLSDPNTETDIPELLEVAIPILQGILQGDGGGEGIDLVGILSPIIASFSAPNRDGNGTVFNTILPLVLPFVTPFIGPIVGPILQGSSNPGDLGGSSITPLIQSLAGPLSQPNQPGGISIASSLISGIVSGLSRDLKTGGHGGSDLGALVSTVVSGVVAGGSAGLSAKFPKPPPSAHPGYTYGQGPVPASSVDTWDLVSSSMKEILGLSLDLVKSIVGSVTGILGASSAKSHQPVYGPTEMNTRM